jgi:pyruvate formate lyase activating enzyme
MYDSKKCVNCAQCCKVCDKGCHTFDGHIHTFHSEKCDACGKCNAVCQAKAIEVVGKKISAKEVVMEIEKDSIFYQTSNGGVTISGGEPLFQPEFTSEILKLCKEKGIHTAIETSGFADEASLKMVLKYCDLVLFDIKETNEENHKKFTGVSLKPILKNLNIVNDMGVSFIIRLPVIPGLNDREEHFYKVKSITENMSFCKGIEIMPYHHLGAYKYELLQKNYLCSNVIEPDNESLTKWKSFL